MKYFTFRPHDKMWKKIQYNLGLLRQNFTDTGYHVINWIHLEAIKLNWNSSMHYCPSGGCVNWPSLDVARLGVCTSHGQEMAGGVQGVSRGWQGVPLCWPLYPLAPLRPAAGDCLWLVESWAHAARCCSYLDTWAAAACGHQPDDRCMNSGRAGAGHTSHTNHHPAPTF